jgi:hypothetical protein
MGLASNIGRQMDALEEDGIESFQVGGDNTDLSGDYTTTEQVTDAVDPTQSTGALVALVGLAVAVVVSLAGGDG